MAFPYIFAPTLEAGTKGAWDTETDTGSILDFPHYTELARFPWATCAPYRGAYCGRIKQSGTADAILIEGDIDIADAGTAYFRWYMNFLSDFVATADDTFNFFELQQAGGTVEQSLGFRVVAATQVINIGIGDGTAATEFGAQPISRNKWHCVELASTVSTSDVGAMTVFVDGVQHATLATLDQAAAVGQGVLGTQDCLATTTGHILFDKFTMDDTRLYPQERFPQTVMITRNDHIFVGPGAIESAALLSTTSTDTMTLWDTDRADVLDGQGMKLELNNAIHSSASGPLVFQKGCYAVLTGTNPRGTVSLMTSSDLPGIHGPAHYSEAGIRMLGQSRKG